MVTSSSGSVKVVVRLRPMNEDQKQDGTMPAVTASGEHKTVSIIKEGQGWHVRSLRVFLPKRKCLMEHWLLLLSKWMLLFQVPIFGSFISIT